MVGDNEVFTDMPAYRASKPSVNPHNIYQVVTYKGEAERRGPNYRDTVGTFEMRISGSERWDKVMETLVEIAKELRDDPDWKGSIIGDPEMLGVDKCTEFGAVIKFMVKTQPDMLFAVRREMLRRISKRFKELRIQITVPQRILLRDDDDAEA